MKHRLYLHIVVAALTTVAALGTHSLRAQGTTYTFVDLGPGAAYSVNNRGQIAGTSQQRAFRITPVNGVWNANPGGAGNPLMEMLPIASTKSGSRGKGINGTGHVGGSVIGSGSNATLWEANGSVKEFGPNSSYADAINGLGDLAGTGSTSRSTTAHLWRKDPKGYKTVSLGVLPGYDQSYAFGVNDARQVVGVLAAGNTRRTAFFWSASGGMSILPTPAGHNGNNCRANAVNGQGVTVGYSIHDGIEHPVLWQNGVARDLLPGSWFQAAALAGINNAAVPEAVGSALWHLDIPQLPVAVLWNGTSWVDLNDPLTTSGVPGGAVLTHALAINDNGDIVGRYTLAGVERAFLLLR